MTAVVLMLLAGWAFTACLGAYLLAGAIRRADAEVEAAWADVTFDTAEVQS